MYPTLPKSYKGLYPFKLCTTSYIYPDHIVPNVEMLAPYMDEIEILLFESAAGSLPSKSEIEKLSRLSRIFDLTYNVHLPLDITPGARDASVRRFALETIKQITELTAPLSPSTFTLHLPYDETNTEKSSVRRWQERNYDSIEQLTAAGLDGKRISIETLEYPLEWVETIINDFDLSVCIDVGHLMVNRFDMEYVFDRYRDRTTIMHLHGVEGRKDHLSLDRLSKEQRKSVMRILEHFQGVISLEVFSYDNLVSSLKALAEFGL